MRTSIMKKVVGRGNTEAKYLALASAEGLKPRFVERAIKAFSWDPIKLFNPTFYFLGYSKSSGYDVDLYICIGTNLHDDEEIQVHEISEKYDNCHNDGKLWLGLEPDNEATLNSCDQVKEAFKRAIKDGLFTPKPFIAGFSVTKAAEFRKNNPNTPAPDFYIFNSAKEAESICSKGMGAFRTFTAVSEFHLRTQIAREQFALREQIKAEREELDLTLYNLEDLLFPLSKKARFNR